MVPGGEAAQVERLTTLATRVSLNLEAPCGSSLAQIAPDKSYETALVSLERARGYVNRERAEERSGRPRDRFRPGGTAGMTMQFVVGATPDTDRTILGSVTALYRGGGIHHTQFSAFRPIRNTPLEDAQAAPALREHRLYQADHLLRQYGFAADEMPYDTGGNLPLALDPKCAWALAHPELFPVEIRTAAAVRARASSGDRTGDRQAIGDRTRRDGDPRPRRPPQAGRGHQPSRRLSDSGGAPSADDSVDAAVGFLAGRRGGGPTSHGV